MNYMLISSFLLSHMCCTYDSNSNTKSKLGNIGRICENLNECKLVINGKLTNRSITNLDIKKLISHQWIQDDYELYLMTQFHGDGCPSMYFLIKLEHHQQFNISDNFGNCNEFDSAQLVQDSLFVHFQMNSIDTRTPITYKFNISNLNTKIIK